MPTVSDHLAASWGAGLSPVEDPYGARHVVALQVNVDSARADQALLLLHSDLRSLAGEYGPRSAELPMNSVPRPYAYAQALEARVRFQRPRALLRVPVGVLSGPAGGHSAQTHSDFAHRVRAALRDRLGRQDTTLAGIAATVAIHPRTLQRALAEEGLPFTEILDCVRRERARALLTMTDLSLTQISEQLGFAESAVFTRNARRWWGTTPSQARQRANPLRQGSGE